MIFKKKFNFVIFLFFFTAIFACSNDKPVLKKTLSECIARDVLEYGRALFNAEYYEKAIIEYRKVIKHFPNDKKECAWAQYELAYSYYYMEDYEEALDEFKKVNELFPNQRGPVILARKMITQISIELYN